MCASVWSLLVFWLIGQKQMYAILSVTTQTIALQISAFFLSLSFYSVILLYTLDHTYRATCLVCPGTQRDSLREETEETETTGCLHSALLSVILVVARVLCFDVCH